MTPTEELQHLRHGAGGQAPPGESDTIEIEADDAALARVREVLGPVLARSAAADQEGWPSVDAWRPLLPAWFVAACADDSEVRECVLDRWSLRAWIYWFQPSLRHWRWWDARTGGDRLTVTLLVLQRPYLRGALEWLLRIARDA